ncbi:hypothetical protein [Lacihabitans sp. CS3-21]|uniref:hypothetical protein n=1 Tax=Lacihabitans sp. CS3-21 TaxID=2487332 RepID=UPI0020CBE1C4|nr:hypothetical protein [Lacihabitans sp. CS3-21]MCP9749179.1 hypothetical protein [Lacihabitans sp. CS3-21]
MEELIIKYFEKKLTDTELEDFEKKLKTDSHFHAEFEFQKSVQSALRSKERSEIKNLLVGFEKQKKQNNWWMFAAAAVVVILGGWVVFLQFLSKPNPSELYLSYYQTYPNVIAPNVRGESQENLKTKAFMAYDSGDYEMATQLFGELKTQISEDYAVFYEGVSYLEVNRPKKTIALFENKKFTNSNAQFEDYRKWYLALAYLKTDKKEQAVEIIKGLSITENPQKEQALKLLDEI